MDWFRIRIPIPIPIPDSDFGFRIPNPDSDSDFGFWFRMSNVCTYEIPLKFEVGIGRFLSLVKGDLTFAIQRTVSAFAPFISGLLSHHFDLKYKSHTVVNSNFLHNGFMLSLLRWKGNMGNIDVSHLRISFQAAVMRDAAFAARRRKSFVDEMVLPFGAQ